LTRSSFVFDLPVVITHKIPANRTLAASYVFFNAFLKVAMAMNLSDIENAFLYVSDEPLYQCSAFLDRDSGKIFYSSELYDSNELPEDVYDSDKYLKIPHKNELELGKNLVFEFISEHLPGEMERMHTIFRKKGAYARYKEFLDAKGFLEKWYTFEDMRQKEALREWCRENGIEITG